MIVRSGPTEPVSEPDVLIIHDPTLLHQEELFAGLGRDGYMLINSTHSFGELGLDDFVKGFHRDRLLVVPASSLAITHLGRPLPGAALLGGFAALTWAVSLDSVLAAITGKFSGPVAEGNAQGRPGRVRLRQGRTRGAEPCLSRSIMGRVCYRPCETVCECPCGAIQMQPEHT